MRKLTAEIREAHSSYDDLTLDSIQKLKYLHQVLQEGLRMYPPVPTHLARRTPIGGATIAGQFVPEDTTVAIHHLSTYRSEANFKNPYKFAPERFDKSNPEYVNDHLDALEPFSTGPRNCVGKNLAWHEMRLLLCTVLLHFDLELCEESSDWSDQKIYSKSTALAQEDMRLMRSSPVGEEATLGQAYKSNDLRISRRVILAGPDGCDQAQQSCLRHHNDRYSTQTSLRHTSNEA